MRNKRYTNFEWYRKAQDVIAHGSLTNSKRPECMVKGIYPTHVSYGQGCKVRDPDGNMYIDFICGLGSSILGYADTQVTEAICQQAFKGTVFSLASTLEVDVANKVKEMVPVIERLRFLKTGTEACQAALKIARAYTGRYRVLSEGYHGWSDPFVSLTPPGTGVPPDANIGLLKDLSQIDGRVAAVIVEPIMTDASPERERWLQTVREKCTANGVVLIFDEVITGFRVPGYTVSKFWKIKPDLICLGKAIANGMPLSVVGGPKKIMECGEYFVSSTFAGETLSLAAALKTMTLLQTKYNLHELWEKGHAFCKKFNEFYPDQIRITGYGVRGVFEGNPHVKALFWQEACRAGILFGPSFFFNFSHFDVTDSVLSTCNDILLRIKTGSVELEGEMPASPFSQKVREQS
jgi:glutamate-1-semialdehyde 2,1-aminomutase